MSGASPLVARGTTAAAAPPPIMASRVPDATPPVAIKPSDPADPLQKRVAIINTGGTIGMKPDASGALEPSPGYLAERVAAMHEFKRPEMPATYLYELLPLLDSSDMGPEDWARIASTVEHLYYEYDGFVIVMGTDTMAYCASALSFLFEHLNKTVILTGAMLPLVDLFNDAHRNLIVSVILSCTLDIPEVCVFINDKLLRGNRTVKVNSSGLDAFDSPNFPPLAQLEVGIRFNPSLCLPQPKGRFRVHKQVATNIAVWRMIPGFDDEYMLASIEHAKGLRAIVLELYGTGNASSRKKSFVDVLMRAIASGIIIVASSQCMRGTVDLGAYALGKKLESIGVVPGRDMTTEAICVKLGYLLSWPGITNEDVIKYMACSLRGELTERATGITGTAGLSLSAALPVCNTLPSPAPGGGMGQILITMATIQGSTRSTSGPTSRLGLPASSDEYSRVAASGGLTRTASSTSPALGGAAAPAGADLPAVPALLGAAATPASAAAPATPAASSLYSDGVHAAVSAALHAPIDSSGYALHTASSVTASSSAAAVGAPALLLSRGAAAAGGAAGSAPTSPDAARAAAPVLAAALSNAGTNGATGARNSS